MDGKVEVCEPMPKCRSYSELNVKVYVYVIEYFMMGCWGWRGMTQGLKHLGLRARAGDIDTYLPPAACLQLTDGWR